MFRSPPQPTWEQAKKHKMTGQHIFTYHSTTLQRRCNDPDPPLADIVLFGLSLCPKGFKTRLQGEGFHTLINGGLFSSPTNVGHHNPPPFEVQRPRWHSFLPPIDVGPPPFGASVLTGTSPRVYPPSWNSEKAGTSSDVWL